ncbi:MAG TPA: hypothetical protein VM529_13355 [Gemmata sp.]|nr:hypothetical protein [Gemmata sp.]
MPGEDPSLRYRITFAGENVTIRYREQVLSGTFTVDSQSDPVTVTMVVTEVKGDGEHTKGTYRALYEIEKTRVSLQFSPKPVALWQVVPRSDKEPPRAIEIVGPNGKKQRITAPAVSVRSAGMGLAPVTLTLHKVAK